MAVWQKIAAGVTGRGRGSRSLGVEIGSLFGLVDAPCAVLYVPYLSAAGELGFFLAGCFYLCGGSLCCICHMRLV